MTNCGAPGCTNRSGNNKNISFHQISSKKEEIKKKWLHNLNSKFIPETLSVCSKHFEPPCFKRHVQAELMVSKPRNILKDDAVPTFFKHSQGPSRKRVSSLETENKQTKKQFVQEALGSYEKTITQTQKEVSCSTKDLIAVTEIGTQNSAQRPNQFGRNFEKKILKRGFKILRKDKPLS